MSKTGITKKKPSKRQVEALTDQQRLFVQYYVTCWHGATAANQAGYAHPGVAACKLLNNPIIEGAIYQEKLHLLKKLGVQAEEVLFNILCGATYTTDDFKDENGNVIENLNSLPLRAKHSVQGLKQSRKTRTYDDGSVEENVEIEYTLVNRPKSQEMLMKHKGLFEANNSQLPNPLAVVIPWDQMYGKPAGATDPDIIEVEANSNTKRLEEK